MAAVISAAAALRSGIVSIGLALPSLRVPAFRPFLIEDSLAGMGLWILQIALAWTMLERTGSGTVVGLLQTMVLLPIPLAIALGGVLTDRFGPRRLMYTSWIVPGLIAVALALVTELDLLTVPLAFLMMLVAGFFIGIYVVPSHIFVARCVEPPLMANAIGLSQLTIGFGRVLGGWAAGAALAFAGPGRSFLIAGGAFLAAALVCFTLPNISGTDGNIGNPWKGLGDAARAVVGSKPMSVVIVLGCVSAVFVYSYLAVTPLVVRHLIGGGAPRLGLLTAAGGVGAITAALVMDPLGRSIGRARLLLFSLALSGLAVLGLGLSRAAIISVLIAFALSASTVTFSATAVLMLQASSALKVRGRVLALFNGLFYVLLPLSEALAGFGSDRIGVTTVLVGAGAMAMLAVAGTALLDRKFALQDVDGTGHLSLLRRAQPLPAGASELPAMPRHNSSV